MPEESCSLSEHPDGSLVIIDKRQGTYGVTVFKDSRKEPVLKAQGISQRELHAKLSELWKGWANVRKVR